MGRERETRQPFKWAQGGRREKRDAERLTACYVDGGRITRGAGRFFVAVHSDFNGFVYLCGRGSFAVIMMYIFVKNADFLRFHS